MTKRADIYQRMVSEIEGYAIYLMDVDGKISSWNKGAELLKGYTAQEIIGKSFSQFFTKKDAAKGLPKKLLDTAFEKGSSADEGWRVRKNGTRFWANLLITAIHDEEDVVIGFVKVTYDLTARKIFENKLMNLNRLLQKKSDFDSEELESRINQIVDYEHAIDESSIVAITDEKCIITHVNDNFCKITKYSREELIGQDHCVLSSESHTDEEIKTLWKTISEGKIWNGEVRNKAKDGTYYWVNMTIVPFLDKTGKPYQYVALKVDVTQRKEAEKEVLLMGRLYAYVSAVNKSIVHINDKQELLDHICEVSIRIGKYAVAWVGLLDADSKLNMISIKGEKEKVERISKFSGSDYSTPEMRDTLTGTVLRTGKYQVSNDALNDSRTKIWKEEMKSFSLRSYISLPITAKGKVIGIFSLLSAEANFFDQKEIALLEEAAGDVSFVLEVMRKDELRQLAEEKVVRNEGKLAEAQHLAKMGSFEIELATGHTHWSDELYRILGFKVGNVEASPERFFGLIHKEDLERVALGFNIAMTELKGGSESFRVISNDGKQKHLNFQWSFEFNINKAPIRIYGIVQDVTAHTIIEQKLVESEAFNRGLLNSLSSEIAVLDCHGDLVAVNQPWIDFALNNHITSLKRVSVGSNYLWVCEQASKEGDTSAADALKGIRSVIRGRKESFYMEYPCHSADAERWFSMRVMRFVSSVQMIVISHDDITNRKIAERKLEQTLLELEDRVHLRTTELEEKNKDILASINYAKRIQKSRLCNREELTAIFPRSFVLSMPRDIVSGDFFWCHQTSDKKFLALADCTGHGVPGALMSLIGHTLLQRIVVEEHIHNPGEILQRLDIQMKEAMKVGVNEVKDGMDIVFCVIDTYFNELYFSGANRPLFMVNADGGITEILPNRYGIGGEASVDAKLFKTARFPIAPGQRLYFSSDGYYDQFGGEHGKKYMRSQFKNTLREIQYTSFDQHRVMLKNNFLDWSENTPQLDDVLVVGVEL